MKTYFLAGKQDEKLYNSGIYHNNLAAARKLIAKQKKEAKAHGEDPGLYCLVAVEAPTVASASTLFAEGVAI